MVHPRVLFRWACAGWSACWDHRIVIKVVIPSRPRLLLLNLRALLRYEPRSNHHRSWYCSTSRRAGHSESRPHSTSLNSDEQCSRWHPRKRVVWCAWKRKLSAATDTMPALAGVAQLVERQPSKLNVRGSSPLARFGPTRRYLTPSDLKLVISPGARDTGPHRNPALDVRPALAPWRGRSRTSRTCEWRRLARRGRRGRS